MSTTTYGWLILLFPLLGSILIGVGFRRLPGVSAGAIGTLAILLSFLSAVGALLSLLGRHEDAREVTSSLWNYAVDGRAWTPSCRSSSIRCRS